MYICNLSFAKDGTDYLGNTSMEDSFWEFEKESKELVERFELMVRKNENYFFDTEEFENIINYYMHKNNMMRCELALNKAMLQHPYSTSLMLKKVHFLICNNLLDRALHILKKLEQTEPDNTDIYMAKACIFSQKGEHQKAIREYEKILLLEEDCVDINMFLAQEYEALGNYDQAEFYYKKELDSNLELDYVIQDLHFLYELQGREEEFIDYIRDYITEHPFSWIAWDNLGLAYYNLLLYEKAIEAFDYVSAINENYIYAYLYKANSLFYLERYNDAIATAHLGLKYQEAPILYCVIGDCYKEKEDFDLAMQYFKEALKRDEDYPYGHIGLALCYSEQGITESAILHLNKALAVEDNNPDFLRIATDIYSNAEMREETEVFFKKLLKIEPRNTEGWLDFSDFLFSIEDIPAAIDVLQQGLIQNPRNAGLTYRLAALHLLKGNEFEGIVCLQEALQYNPLTKELFDYAPELTDNETVIEIIKTHNSERNN